MSLQMFKEDAYPYLNAFSVPKSEYRLLRGTVPIAIYFNGAIRYNNQILFLTYS